MTTVMKFPMTRYPFCLTFLLYQDFLWRRRFIFSWKWRTCNFSVSVAFRLVDRYRCIRETYYLNHQCASQLSLTQIILYSYIYILAELELWTFQNSAFERNDIRNSPQLFFSQFHHKCNSDCRVAKRCENFEWIFGTSFGTENVIFTRQVINISKMWSGSGRRTHGRIKSISKKMVIYLPLENGMLIILNPVL
jgi:hypothetical protein